MKLCLLANNGSVHNQKWIKSLSEKDGMELHVITFNKGIKFNNVVYHYLKQYTGTKADYLLNIPFLKKKLRSIRPDILHAHYATSYGFMGAFSNFHPYVITGWGADIFDSPGNRMIKKILMYSLKRADAITVLSKITLRQIARFTNKHVDLIPFGVDAQKFFPAGEKKNDMIRIGTIRTLTEKYGVEYLIRAFALLYPKYPDIRLEIVGDGELKDFLKNLAWQLGVSDRVIFHGFVSQTADFEKYIRLLGGFDIFAILSVMDSETFGVAAVEASACGLPVIASAAGGLPEVVDDGVTGIIVPPKNSLKAAEAIEKLILDRELRESMGKNGRMKVERFYNWANNVEQMLAVYKRVLKNKT